MSLTSPGSGVVITSPPTRAPLPSRCPRAGGSPTASRGAGTGSSTTPSHRCHHPDPLPALAGRAFFERKVADGKTKREAVRTLKRRIADAVYRQLLIDARGMRGPGGQSGTAL